MKIANKISLSFFGISLILITITGIVSYTVARFSLADAIYNHLETSASLHTEMIRFYLETLKKSVVQVSKSVVLPAALNTAKNDPAYGKAVENAVKLLMSKKDADSSAYKYMLLNASGTVVASSKITDIGLDRSMDAYFLGAQKSVYIKDAHYPQREKLPLMAVSAPIIDSNTGLFLGVLVEHVTLDALYHITMDRTGLGRTGEVIIINKYGYLISPSRYEENTFLRKRITTDMTRRILQYRDQGSLSVHKELLHEYSDYRGVPVLGMYDYITDPGWGS